MTGLEYSHIKTMIGRQSRDGFNGIHSPMITEPLSLILKSYNS